MQTSDKNRLWFVCPADAVEATAGDVHLTDFDASALYILLHYALHAVGMKAQAS